MRNETMKNLLRTSAILIATFSLASQVNAHSLTKQYPHQGDIYYDGGSYADSNFSSHAPYGGWKTNTFFSDPGLEIDINIDRVFFDSCTSWSNMPRFYDDCVTGGVFDGSGRSFGIGTYDARLLQTNTTYQGRWYFTGGTGSAANVSVSWQEVFKDLCPVASPWCMSSIAGGRFLTTVWSRGKSDLRNWYY